MGRMYSVEFEAVAVTAAVDMFELRPADDKPISVHALFISQSSDLGDAAEEIIRYRAIRGNATTGTGGATPTPRPLDPNDAAASFGCDTNNTGAATGGTEVVLHSGGFNIRIGEQLILPPEMRWHSVEGSFIVVRLMAAPADSLTMSGTMYVEEF